MAKPYLLAVTGRPGSGKTTFAKKLGNEIYMPVISRDEIKEGYVHTFGRGHAELPKEANKTATGIFFDTLMELVANNVSVIAEAAFQHEIWSAMLEPFMGKARIYLLICKVDDRVALDRFVRRGLDRPLREYFHGGKEAGMAGRGTEWSAGPYEEPRLNAPTFYIDTSGEYSPSIEELGRKILGEWNHMGPELAAREWNKERRRQKAGNREGAGQKKPPPGGTAYGAARETVRGAAPRAGRGRKVRAGGFGRLPFPVCMGFGPPCRVEHEKGKQGG